MFETSETWKVKHEMAQTLCSSISREPRFNMRYVAEDALSD